jgi:hypothetical protein
MKLFDCKEVQTFCLKTLSRLFGFTISILKFCPLIASLVLEFKKNVLSFNSKPCFKALLYSLKKKFCPLIPSLVLNLYPLIPRFV